MATTNPDVKRNATNTAATNLRRGSNRSPSGGIARVPRTSITAFDLEKVIRVPPNPMRRPGCRRHDSPHFMYLCIDCADGPFAFRRLVQLRLRLRLVPIRPRRDVLQLRLEEVVEELLLRVLHLREDLARSRRADAVDRVRVDRPLAVYRHEIRNLLRTGEEFSFFVR